MEEGKWYMVHTYSGYEAKVADGLTKTVNNRNLQDLIQDVKVPVEIVTEVKDGKEKTRENKLFPSYVFVKMILTDQTWYIVRNTRGVTGFVGANSSKPEPLSDKEVDSLGIEVVTKTVDFAVGDQVEITTGPLEGFVGEVIAVDLNSNIVKVKVSMFGRDTETELDLLRVKPI